MCRCIRVPSGITASAACSSGGRSGGRGRKLATQEAQPVALRIQVIFGGLANGAIYGLAALGLTFIYRVTGMLNFAQGMVLTLAGLTYARLVMEGFDILPAALVAIVGAAVLSGLI